VPTAVDADLEFRCPRCGDPATERFYGPCARCRQELVGIFGDAGSGPEAEVGTDAEVVGGEATTARFEPGLHVVPNHVATKD